MTHVPQFGKWEVDAIPYTTAFDNARINKFGVGGKPINPNDPQQNPNAFINDTRHANHVARPKPSAYTSSGLPPSSPVRTNPMAATRANKTPERGPRAVPKFGEWTDPSAVPSGGYTVIFNQVREGKSTPAPDIPVPNNTDKNNQHDQKHYGHRSDNERSASWWKRFLKAWKSAFAGSMKKKTARAIGN